MTRVDFYVLPAGGCGDRLTFACRIAEKAFLQDHKIYVHSASATEAEQLDGLLWTFRDASFVPHAIVTAQIDDDPELPPVLIGYDDATGAAGTDRISSLKSSNASGDALLINMAGEVPNFFERFARVAELIGAGEDDRQLGRARFRFYRDRGCPVETHRL
ncbi:DNA polymerase III subunit chi [soil metagenome]